MARESKRKRDEKRFGRPERLANQMKSWTWLAPRDGSIDPYSCIEALNISTCIVADNVGDYFRRNSSKEWSWVGMPPIRLPFPSMFIEIRSSTHRGPLMFGAILQEFRTASNVLDEVRKGINPQYTTSIDSDMEMLTNKCSHVIDFGVFTSSETKERVAHIAKGTAFLDDNYMMLRSPFGQIRKDFATSIGSVGDCKGFIWEAIYPMFLSVGFMNCKNVEIKAVEPNASINQKRKKAGLNPFVRYHTINIEPMKQVLKTDGNIESNGLKRALHICRGHFATYRESFLGRPLEKPVTVWRPSHVRGSAKEGVVISDYKVNAPKESIK